MSKKRTGLWIAFGAVLGAAAAGISYYLKYKSFNDELEQDFHDYEEEEDAKEEKNSGAVSCGESGRSYIHLNSGKCAEGSALPPTRSYIKHLGGHTQCLNSYPSKRRSS